MFCLRVNLARLMLIITNMLFMATGLGLVGGSIFLLLDFERVLISRVIITGTSQPLFYYAALLFILTGLIVSTLSVLGCWATHCHNNCLLAIYLFLLVVLLIVESVGCVLAVVCPQYLGIIIEREELLDTWQRYYGVPGREQFTAAVDLIQTTMRCCGVEGSGDYGTTWWRLRELAAPDLLVPLSCCVLHEPPKYLDPDPVNATICQDNQPEIYQTSRYTEGCLTQLESWLDEQILLGVSSAAILVLVQLLLLLLAILMCVKAANTSKDDSKRHNHHQYNHNHRDNSISSKQSFPHFVT